MPRLNHAIRPRRSSPRWQAIDWWSLILALGAIALLVILNGVVR